MKFSPLVAVILGAILAAAEAVQLQITMSMQAHNAITLVVTILSGLGVLVASPAKIAMFVPHQILVVITALIGALNVLQSSFSMTMAAHTIIAVVLVILTTLFSSSSNDAPVAPASLGGAS